MSAADRCEAISADAVLRSRRDIVWLKANSSGGDAAQTQWTAFDPIARVAYRCGEAERWLFDQFDGRRSLADIHRSLAVHAELQILRLSELLVLAKTLWSRGLLRLQSAIDEVSTQPARRSLWNWFTQSVSWRMRGLNPDRLLDWIAPHANLFFSRMAIYAWLMAACIVGLLVLTDFQRLSQQATVWQWLMRPSSGTSLFVIFVVTRAIHELGHALALKRLGGRCPDIGVIFVLGAPCVYCDVTDSWRLPTARQRSLVAAAGMYAELIVATLAGAFWWNTVASPINTLALQTMFVCSVSTILINANPLMRFDGYYILSDWLDQPNLRAHADRCLTSLFESWVSHGTKSLRLSSPGRWTNFGLAAFSAIGVAYRMSLSYMMAGVIVALYTAWHAPWLGRAVAIALLFAWWVVPMLKFTNQLYLMATNWWARVRLSLLAAWVVLMTFAIPLPCRISTQGWVQPTRMQGIYATADARISHIAKATGQAVEAGETIVQLEDTLPKLRAIELEHAVKQTQIQLVSLRRQQYTSQASAEDLSALEKALVSQQLQNEHALETVDRLNLRASISGRLHSLPAPRVHELDRSMSTTDAGLWLEPQQVGRAVGTGTMLAAVCSDERMVVVPLDDNMLSDITIGTETRIHMPAAGNEILQGRVSDIVRLEQLDSIDRLMSEIATNPDGTPASSLGSSTGSARKRAGSMSDFGFAADSAGYAAIVPLQATRSGSSTPAFIGATARVTFVVAPKTVARRAAEWLHANARWIL